MGGMVHVYKLAWYNSMILRDERQMTTNVVWSLQSQINALTVFESRKYFASNINLKYYYDILHL